MNKKEFKKHYNKVMYFTKFDDPKYSDLVIPMTGKKILGCYDESKDDPKYLKIVEVLMSLTQDQLNFYNFDFERVQVRQISEEEYLERQIDDLYRKEEEFLTKQILDFFKK